MKKLELKKYRLLISVFLTAVFLISACSANSKLNQAMKKWNAQGITHYRIGVWHMQSVWHLQTYEIEVDGDQISHTASCITAPAESYKCEITEYDPNSFTIDGLFATAERILDKEGSKWVQVRYNALYGYPEYIGYDHPEIWDEDVAWIVKTFDPLP